MNKRFMVIGFLILLISVSIAGYVINQSITQSEYNKIDFDSLDLNMTITNKYIENNRVFIEFEYQTFEFDSDLNEYVYQTRIGKIPYYLGFYEDCLNTKTTIECNSEMINQIYVSAENFREDERVKLSKFKTKDVLDVLSNLDFGDNKNINHDLYVVGTNYVVGDKFVYENKLYEVIQSHVSQSDWLPSSLPALYKLVVNSDNSVSEWVQPISSVDCYALGDKVLFNGSIYESLINANVWSPSVYPQGWRKI